MKELSKNAKEVLNTINVAYSGIATRTNLIMETGMESKKLSRAIQELKRKNIIEIFRSALPEDNYCSVYKISKREQ